MLACNRPPFDWGSVQSVPDNLLYFVLCFRDPIEYPSQEMEAAYLVEFNYGGMGNCHDCHGVRT